MKTLLTIIVITFLIFTSKAQDTTLPRGNCSIYLTSGKIMKNVKLWKIGGNLVEYSKDNSLHDISTEEIDFIKYGYSDYAISDSAQLYKIEYDAIIFKSGDTLFCFIKEIWPDKIYFVQWGKANVQYVFRSDVKKHLLKGIEDNPQGSTLKAKPAAEIPAIKDTTESSGYAASVKPKTDYAALGKRDARNEFRGYGSFTGGMICGVVPVFGWIAGAVTMVVPPFIHPSNELYNSNLEYHEAYQKEAHKKKARKTLGGLACGAVLIFALL